MLRVFASLLLVLLLATACSTSHAFREVRFNEQERANLIVRYYTDDTSYVLKPQTTEGPFLRVLGKDEVVAVAKQQAGRELAVVVLIHYGSESEAQEVKQKWVNLLQGVGYQRVVFLRALSGMQVEGLPVMAGGG